MKKKKTSKLREFRKFLGLTQIQFATILDINRRSYICYENQLRYPKTLNCCKILAFAKEKNFAITLDDLTKK